MGLRISKGRLRKPLRVVMYGVEGIGKTTLASQFPKPIFLDTEGSTVHLDVDRVPNPNDESDPVLRTWLDLTGAMLALIRDRQGYETVVIDSADWAERLATVHLLASDKEKKKTSIEDFGFGKGYVMLAEIVGKCLALCDEMVRAGLNVVWVAHSKVVRVSPPEQTDGFDRYEMKLHKQVAPLFKEWADAVFFLTYRTVIVEGDDGRNKGRGGKERIIHAERSAAWDAKNRFGLGETIPMTMAALAPMFAAAGPAVPAKPAQAAAGDRKGWLERVNEATTVEQLSQISDDADLAESNGELSPSQRKRLDSQINIRHQQLEPQEVSDGVA